MKRAGAYTTFIFCLYFSCCLRAQDLGKSFYILASEYEEGSSVNLNQAIVRYNFDNGNFSGKEKLFSVATKKRGSKEDYVRLDIGTNTLYRNRYVIAGNGPILDLQTKKVVGEEKAQLVKCSGDSIIFFTNDIFKGKYYSWFSLSGNTYHKIEDPSYKALPGQDVEVDQSAETAKIWYYPGGAEKKLLVEDAGTRPGKKFRLPIYWLDNENFIYPYYAKDNSVTLYKVSTKKGKEKIAAVKPDGPADTVVAPRFYRNSDAALVFEHSPHMKYTVDVKGKKMEWQESESLGNGFTISLTEYRNTGRSIKYKGEEIGNYYCNYLQSKSKGDIVVVPFEISMKNERYSQGMMVWTAGTRKWKNVDNPDIMGIIAIVEK